MIHRLAGLCLILIVVTACAPTATEPSPPPSPELSPTETPLPPPTQTPEPTPVPTAASPPTPSYPTEQIEVPYEDRVIRGTLVGEGDLILILAPGFEETRADFMLVAEYVVPLGYAAVGIDFPGFGASTGEFSFSKGGDDILAVMDYLNERGFERIVCLGGSLGGAGCINAALVRPDMAGLVLVSSLGELTQEEAAVLTMPKLLIAGNVQEDTGIMRELFAAMSQPKELLTFPSEAHSSDLFRSNDGPAIHEAIAAFLEELG